MVSVRIQRPEEREHGENDDRHRQRPQRLVAHVVQIRDAQKTDPREAEANARHDVREPVRAKVEPRERDQRGNGDSGERKRSLLPAGLPMAEQEREETVDNDRQRRVSAWERVRIDECVMCFRTFALQAIFQRPDEHLGERNGSDPIRERLPAPDDA